MSEAVYTVVGSKSVFGVAPGDSSDFEGVDPGALHALIAGGHIDYAKTPDVPVEADSLVAEDIPPAPEPEPPAPEPEPPAEPASDAPVAPVVQQEQQAPPAGTADDTSKEA